MYQGCNFILNPFLNKHLVDPPEFNNNYQPI